MDAGKQFLDEIARSLFVRWISERKQVAHRNRSYPIAYDKVAGGDPDFVFIERAHYRSVGSYALGDPDSAMPRREEGGSLGLQKDLVHTRPLLPPDLQRIFEALGHQYTGDGAFALEQRVDRDRASMDESGDLRGSKPRDGEDLFHAVPHPGNQITGRRRHLRVLEKAILA